MQKQIVIFLLPLLVVMLLSTACGQGSLDINPQVPPTSEAVEEESPTAESLGAEAQNSGEESAEENAEPAAPAVEVVAESSATFEGIQVGFTAEGRPYRGNPDAPVLIEEYSDYQCPFCARFTEQTMPSLLENQIAAGSRLVGRPYWQAVWLKQPTSLAVYWVMMWPIGNGDIFIR